MNKKYFLSITVLAFFVVAFWGCSKSDNNQKASSQSANAPKESQSENSNIANPASTNCAEKGGQLKIEKNGKGEYGVCIFEDNLQCEEWAMLRGDCPVGGVKITGYVTEAARYCAITGGEYSVTGNSGMENEQGICKFKNQKECDAQKYYNGDCNQESATSSNAGSDAKPTASAVFKCKDEKTISADFFENYVELKLSDGRSMKLNQALSADGGRYASSDEAIVFWNKGDTAFMTEGNKTTFEDCVEKQ